MSDIDLKALIVDDNEINTLVLTNILDLFGIHVDHAYSGKDAIELYRNEQYDLIFIDHYMPDMNGIETAYQLRLLDEENKTIRFALTALTTDELKPAYNEVGVEDVLTKPLGLNEVYNLLKKYFPYLAIDEIAFLHEEEPQNLGEEFLLKTLLTKLPIIKYEEGLKYAIGSPKQFARILKASIQDIQASIDAFIHNRDQNNDREILLAIHNLKSLFSNIGAIELYEKTKTIYTLVKENELARVKRDITKYIAKISDFNLKLRNLMLQYETYQINYDDKDTNEHHQLTDQEYEQCILSTIYYIKSYNYNSIIDSMQGLIRCGRPEHKEAFIEVLEKIKNYKYEEALSIIVETIKKDR